MFLCVINLIIINSNNIKTPQQPTTYRSDKHPQQTPFPPKEYLKTLLANYSEGTSVCASNNDVYQLLGEVMKFVHQYQPLACPHCGSILYNRDGTYHTHLHRYKCKSCGTKYNDLTGTPFHYLKKLDIAFLYILRHLCTGTAVRTVGKMLHIAPKTALFWRHKFGIALGSGNPKTFDNNLIELYEYVIEINKKGSRHEKGKVYPPEKKVTVFKTNGAKEVTVSMSMDRKRNIMFNLENIGNGMPKEKMVEWMKKHCGCRKRLMAEGETLLKLREMGYGKRKVFEAIEVVEGEKRLELDKAVPVVGRNLWRTVNLSKESIDVYEDWGSRFYGVATKYLRVYLNIHVANLMGRNSHDLLDWFGSWLLARDTYTEYHRVRRIQVE